MNTKFKVGEKVLITFPHVEDVDSKIQHLHKTIVTLESWDFGWRIKEDNNKFIYTDRYFSEVPRICSCKEPKFVEYMVIGITVYICKKCGFGKEK
jgi:hypothetical protein